MKIIRLSNEWLNILILLIKVKPLLSPFQFNGKVSKSHMNIWVLLQGMGLGASLIIPIGAQNAYVLNQGIRKHHHITIATVCSVLDIVFISVGVFGGGAVISSNPIVLSALTVGGAGFLSFYAFLSLKSALSPVVDAGSGSDELARGRQAAIWGALAVTLLNPHLYLDTIVILGSIGGQLNESDRLSFAVGSIMMSFIWFYGLSFTAAKLSPILSKAKVRRGIDIVIALFMLFVAATLLRHFL